MSVARRHHLTVALIAALAGAGIGLEAAHGGFQLAPTLGFWVGALGIVALVIVLLTAPAESSAPAMTSAESGWAEFRREMRRARRGVKALTILRVPYTDRSLDDASLAARSEAVGSHLRLVDRTWVDDGSIYVLLPESPRQAAESLLTRVRSAAPELLPADVRVATFPDDGLTSGAIIAAVHGAALEEVPIPIRASVAEAGEALDDQVVGEKAAQ
jgi:hypothetical protein